MRRGIVRSFDNATATIWGKNLTNFPDSAINWAGYTPTTFTKNLVVTLPENGVLGNRATGLFRGQACARRANAHCEADCDPEVTHPPCVPCDTAAGCSASFLDSFSHDIFQENMYWNAAARGLPSAGQFPGRCIDCSNSTWESWRRQGFDNDSLVADPLFQDAANNDFRLRKDSPARALGIRSVDVKLCGPSW